jgi:hypothetical protein
LISLEIKRDNDRISSDLRLFSKRKDFRAAAFSCYCRRLLLLLLLWACSCVCLLVLLVVLLRRCCCCAPGQASCSD